MKFGFLTIIVMTVCGSVYGAEALSWTQLIDEAARNNAELRAGIESLRASQYSAKAAYSGFFPQITGALNTSYGTSNSLSAQENYSATASVTQGLFNGFQDKAKVELAAAQVQVQEAKLDGIKAKVSADLKKAYADIVFAQRSVSLQQSIIRRRDDNLKLVDLRFQSGRENKGSVLLSKAYLDQARYEAFQARNNERVAQSQLAQVLGRDEESDLILKGEVPLVPPAEAPDFKALAVLTPEHRQAIAEEQSAEAGVTAARIGFFPTLTLNATIGRSGQDWFPESQHWSVGAGFSFPFFSGGKDYFGTQSAVATLASASGSRRNADRQTLAALMQAYTTYLEATQKLSVDESFRGAALKRAEIARSKYNTGLMNFEDWNLIENELIAREKAVLQSQRDRTAAEAAWQQVQGKGVFL